MRTACELWLEPAAPAVPRSALQRHAAGCMQKFARSTSSPRSPAPGSGVEWARHCGSSNLVRLGLRVLPGKKKCVLYCIWAAASRTSPRGAAASTRGCMLSPSLTAQASRHGWICNTPCCINISGEPRIAAAAACGGRQAPAESETSALSRAAKHVSPLYRGDCADLIYPTCKRASSSARVHATARADAGCGRLQPPCR